MANKTVTVKSSGGDYTSLNAAFAGEDDINADLTATGMDGILTIECYAMNDTTVAKTGTGYTTDSSHYINVTAPAGQRHSGVWTSSKYNLVTTAWDYCLNSSADYTRFDGLQVSLESANSTASVIVDSSTNGGMCVTNCLVRRPAASADAPGILIKKNGTVINSIVYGASLTKGIHISYGSNVQSYIYNCVVTDATQDGIYCDYGDTSVKNTVVFNTADDFHADNGTLSIDYCASDDGDGTNHQHLNENAGGEWDAAFTDYANGDFSLKAGGVCCDTGTSLAGTFTTDITGATRSGTWDIGAFKYTPAGTEYRPIYHNHYQQMRIV